jgi:MFS family permease
MGVGSCKVVALVIATMFFDRVGRKPMLLLSAAGLVLAYVIEAIRYMCTCSVLDLLCMH